MRPWHRLVVVVIAAIGGIGSTGCVMEGASGTQYRIGTGAFRRSLPRNRSLGPRGGSSRRGRSHARPRIRCRGSR
jgi:hypothetical protein